MERILISPNLNFTVIPLGCYGLSFKTVQLRSKLGCLNASVLLLSETRVVEVLADISDTRSSEIR